jgi:hypothetical protein
MTALSLKRIVSYSDVDVYEELILPYVLTMKGKIILFTVLRRSSTSNTPNLIKDT